MDWKTNCFYFICLQAWNLFTENRAVIKKVNDDVISFLKYAKITSLQRTVFIMTHFCVWEPRNLIELK